MNPVIETFLENYTCEQIRPNRWQGTFSKTRKLHKLRDNLTEADWEDIKDFASPGFWEMPVNLRNSAQRKFDDWEHWCAEHRLTEFSFPVILNAAKDTPHYDEARRLIWGCLTSCIEAGYWSLQD